MIKTYRGLLADGGQDRIRLQTIKGKVGYRIVKFEMMPNQPGDASSENVLMIWKRELTTVPTSGERINFGDSDLLGALYYQSGTSSAQGTYMMVVFDNEIFNQDIYITHTDNGASTSASYYVELEVIPLDDAGAEYTTLKDMRQV